MSFLYLNRHYFFCKRHWCAVRDQLKKWCAKTELIYKTRHVFGQMVYWSDVAMNAIYRKPMNESPTEVYLQDGIGTVDG